MQSRFKNVLRDLVIYNCMSSCRFFNAPCSCAQRRASQSSGRAGYLLTTLCDNLSHPAANVLVEVLYAAMDSPHHCQYILSGNPQAEGFKKLDVLLSLQKAFKTPGDIL